MTEPSTTHSSSPDENTQQTPSQNGDRDPEPGLGHRPAGLRRGRQRRAEHPRADIGGAGFAGGGTDDEGALTVIEDCVEIDDAVSELRQIAWARSGVTDIIGRTIRLQCIHIAGSVERHKVAEYRLLRVRRLI